MLTPLIPSWFPTFFAWTFVAVVVVAICWKLWRWRG